jgi:hypothetical protein
MVRPAVAGTAFLILITGPSVFVERTATAAATQTRPAAGTSSFSPAELDRLLAPIALYPDALLGQILLCATKPSTVGALAEWLASQPTLKGTALQDAAKASGFEEGCVALLIFPDVVDRLAAQMEWTAGIGRAFTADRSAVFASIQRLRAKARDAGKLKDTPQQDVETRTTTAGEQVIVIEPANPQVVYVPQYNPQTVYTTSTVVIQEQDDSSAAVAAGLIGFTAGIAIGAAYDNDYYYGPYGWRGGFYMYDDAWDDWYDHREDAREDWADHREDIVEDRGDRARTAQEQRTERSQTRQENRPEAQAQREGRQAGTQASGTARSSAEARGYSRDGANTAAERSGTRSDAFSGYSSGRSERSASTRGRESRSGSRSGGRRR